MRLHTFDGLEFSAHDLELVNSKCCVGQLKWLPIDAWYPRLFSTGMQEMLDFFALCWNKSKRFTYLALTSKRFWEDLLNDKIVGWDEVIKIVLWLLFFWPRFRPIMRAGYLNQANRQLNIWIQSWHLTEARWFTWLFLFIYNIMI